MKGNKERREKVEREGGEELAFDNMTRNNNKS
jgi:hypothetical protein